MAARAFMKDFLSWLWGCSSLFNDFYVKFLLPLMFVSHNWYFIFIEMFLQLYQLCWISWGCFYGLTRKTASKSNLKRKKPSKNQSMRRLNWVLRPQKRFRTRILRQARFKQSSEMKSSLSKLDSIRPIAITLCPILPEMSFRTR